jgi:hypothetical protein
LATYIQCDTFTPWPPAEFEADDDLVPGGLVSLHQFEWLAVLTPPIWLLSNPACVWTSCKPENAYLWVHDSGARQTRSACVASNRGVGIDKLVDVSMQ